MITGPSIPRIGDIEPAAIGLTERRAAEFAGVARDGIDVSRDGDHGTPGDADGPRDDSVTPRGDGASERRAGVVSLDG